MADNPTLLSSFARVSRIRMLAFILGSGLAACAACLLALDVGVTPSAGLELLLVAAVAVIIGSTASFEGALLGALALGLVQSLVAWLNSAKWSQATTYLFLAAVLLLRPEGLFGKQRRKEDI